MTNSKKIKWGILGTSFISEVMIAAIQASEHGVLVGIAGRSLPKAEKLSKDFSIPKSYAAYQDLLDDEEIDVVYIGLPNHLHKEWTLRAAQAGKHILCEKPFAISEADAKEMIATAEKHHVFCMEAIMYRCHPFTKKLKELLADGVVGEIKLIHANYTANIADIANPLEGGSIRNLGCYPVSLIRYLLNEEPKEILGMGRLNPKNSTDNQGSAILKFSHDVMAVVSTADDMEMSWQFDIYGTKGILKILTNPWLPDLNNTIVIQKPTQASPVEMNIAADKSLYVYQIDAVNRCVINQDWQSPDAVSLQESLGNTIVLESWRELICKV